MWLLLYHPDVRPTELIYLDMIQWVGGNSTTFTIHINNTIDFREQKFKQTGEDRQISVKRV
jgi:hypothetical protein